MRYFFCLWLLPMLSPAQFAPPVGQAGTTALHKDSSAFINWANYCTITRGLQDISNGSGGYPTIGDSSKALNKADNSVVSLGDGGIAICTFQNALSDGPGPDFAVFENSFSDDYLEFGFVEVSSDGINFFRFPATCNIQDTAQTGSFGLSNASLVNNLAGKYRALYGTPFDLQELQGTAGLNVNAVTHVKIIDVVGSINASYATYDQNNHKINDPWPTAFASSGFDLDAVGVIHDVTNSISVSEEINYAVYPNPTTDALHIISGKECSVQLTEITGAEITAWIKLAAGDKIDLPLREYGAGMYLLKINDGKKRFIKKIVVTQ